VTAPRYELPDGVSPEEERAIIAALERYLEDRDTRPSPWVMAGRLENARTGAVQARRFLRDAWRVGSSDTPFARYGTEPIGGRGDAA
jgi:hypothetical protein